MWLAWRERVDVYLGLGIALVRRPDRALVTLEHPATWPLGDVLARVDEVGERGRCGPWRVNAFLSAALCPAVPFQLPAGVQAGGHEALAVARITAAAAWGLPARQAHELACALDAGRTHLAAAMMAGTSQTIREWAALGGGRLASLQPLWATAAGAPGCRSSRVQRMVLHEPGAVTALFDAPDGIHLRFSPQVLPYREQWGQAPRAWAGHWELLT